MLTWHPQWLGCALESQKDSLAPQGSTSLLHIALYFVGLRFQVRFAAPG